jgi:dienelactone hydrolase
MKIVRSLGYVALTGMMSIAAAQENLAVLPETLDGGVTPQAMTRTYLLGQGQAAWKQWQDRFEAVDTPEKIAEYQQQLPATIVSRLGGWPERTDLNPQVVGTLERPGYRVEKIIFESLPKFFVTAALFLPVSDRFQPPYPGVLIPCGHAQNAKAHIEYQTMGALLALNGLAALVFDPIEQGERMQLVDAAGAYAIHGTEAHTTLGAACILLGRNTARFEIWDGIRGLDYLQARPEVDPTRIGVTGNSGGGTQTSYLMALDERIRAAAPSCFLNKAIRQLEVATGDAEQNVFGQLAFGLEHADFLMMRAPTPILICAATQDFFDINATWESFRYAKRRFTSMGFSERVAIMENNAKHNYNKLQREAAARWLVRWLQGRDEAITEPEIQTFTDEELRCTPVGQAMLLPEARSAYDFNADYEDQLAPQRQQRWASEDHAALLEQVRQTIGMRKLAELPAPEIQEAGDLPREGYTIKKLIITSEPGIYLPALLFVPGSGAPTQALVYVNTAGKAADAQPGGSLDALAKQGALILAVDLRGSGETQQINQKQYGEQVGLDWEDYFLAYALGRSYVGMRAEDLLVCARHAAERAGAAQVNLWAVGNMGVPALHAAALEPGLFATVKLTGTLNAWSNVIHSRPSRNQLINAVHGALTFYDLPDLASTLAGKLTIEQPVDAQGNPV